MSSKISPIINPKELLSLKSSPDLVLVDARAGAGIKEKFLANHLEGALHVDLDIDLADIKPDAANGGRHPLPSPQKFTEVLKQLGISPESYIVIYDDKSGANAAARFWWMLKAMGHSKVQVLNGGMDAAIKAGFPVSDKEENFSKNGNYLVTKWALPMADINEVEVAAQDENAMVIDVRDAYRYNGEKEPIDLIAGHIPGAENIPFSQNLDENGFFLPPSLLKEKYQKAMGKRTSNNTIVHCGSGVTACHTLLAMDYAGLEIPKLYVGSWSEWSRNNKPIGKK